MTANKLTKDQETKLLARLASKLDNLINDVHGVGGFGFKHDHGGWGGPDNDENGPPADGSPPPAAPADLAPAPGTA